MKYYIDVNKRLHRKTQYGVIEKFDKPNEYGDIEIPRAVFYTMEKAKMYIKNMVDYNEHKEYELKKSLYKGVNQNNYKTFPNEHTNKN